MNPYVLIGLFVSGLTSGYFLTSNYYDAKLYEQQQAAEETLKERIDAFAEVETKAIEQKQKVIIKWRTKNEIIYRDRNRADVLCYDDVRMQRKITAINDANLATGSDAATATYPTPD